MSNILIIKHGSLGDIAQISGALRDIREHHQTDKIFILTTMPYAELMSRCPFIDAVLIDKRLPRWNLLYLLKLKKMIKKLNIIKTYDLQNSSRTSFYRKYLFNISNWSSTETALNKGMKKNQFDQNSVLDRFKFQLDNSGINTNYSLKPDFSWACTNVNNTVNKRISRKFILIFPFCSPQLSHKKWPYYNELIKIIKESFKDIKIVVAPGPKEIEEAKNIDAISITKEREALNIMELATLIKDSSFIVANDTGPAHMAAHLGAKGLVIFGQHTTAKKVSIETDKFKALTVESLDELTANKVFNIISKELRLVLN